MKWFLLLVPGGCVLLLALTIWRWHLNREEHGRVSALWALAAQPVIINGEERQPQLRREIA